MIYQHAFLFVNGSNRQDDSAQVRLLFDPWQTHLWFLATCRFRQNSSHKSVIGPFGIATVCVLRYCSDTFVQLRHLGHSLEAFEASVPPKSEASDQSAQARQSLEFFLQITRQIEKGWHQRNYIISSPISFDILCLLRSNSCIFYFLLAESGLASGRCWNRNSKCPYRARTTGAAAEGTG